MPHCGIPLPPPFPPSSLLRSLMEVAPQSGRGILDEEEDQEEEEIESVSSFYNEEDDDGDDDDDDASSVDRELMEDAATTSSASSNSLCPSSTSSSPGDPLEEGPLFEMSSLISLLPVKRGLSKHFDGKSQSFTSLASVRSLEDLAKPERRCKKRLKSCRSFGESLGCHRAPSPKARAASKKASPLLNARRQRFLGHRPPMYPQAASRLSAGHTLLFA